MRLPKLASPGDGAKAPLISIPQQAKTMDLRWLWLLIGFALLPFTAYRVVFPLAAWIAPVFLLRFERVSRRGGPALWLIFAAYMLAGVIDLIGSPGRGLDLLLGLTFFPLVRAVRFTLPYVTDRLLGARLGTWPRMLLFPASFVASDWLMGLLHLTGTFGSPAYSQYGVLPLIQLVSVTGMYGLTFLVMWFASAVNAVWEHGFQRRATRLPLAVFGSVLAAVFAFGFARLSLAAPTSPTVKAATITLSPAVYNQANDGLDLMTFNRATSAQRAAWRPRFNATVDQMLARTQTALSQGAKLVAWQEQSALVLPEDRQNAISRAAALARSHGAYLEIWLGVLNRSQSLPYFADQAVLISPAGTVVWTYEKTYLVLGSDSAFTVRGSGVLPVADTPYGRLTTAICNDLDYPGLLRQAGQKGADILLAPNNEDYSFQASYRAGEQVYRAIENGTSLIRPAGDGISLMTDYLGRVIASQDYSASNDGIMLASVPTTGVSTIYSHIGDSFAYLCTLGLVLGIHLARRAKRNSARTSPAANDDLTNHGTPTPVPHRLRRTPLVTRLYERLLGDS
jgi:apolipoprotein N-acyltransferase